MRTTIVIYTNDNRAYAGATAMDVVRRMLEANVFTVAKTPEEYMAGVARRHAALDRHTVRTDTPERFLTDLAACGAIEISKAN